MCIHDVLFVGFFCSQLFPLCLFHLLWLVYYPPTCSFTYTGELVKRVGVDYRDSTGLNGGGGSELYYNRFNNQS